MLGKSHAVMGAAGWLAAAPSLSAALGTPLTPAELAVGTVACAGAALIPDLDHPQATIAHTFGPVSHAASKVTAFLAGGHRKGTHSLLFVGLFGFLCYTVAIGTEASGSNIPAIILMFLLAAFAFRGLNIVPPNTSKGLKGIMVIAEAAVLTWAMTLIMPESWWWLGLAGALGAFIHLIGDALTPEGVPFFYPLFKYRFALPIISTTGNALERVILYPLWIVLVVYLAFDNFVGIPAL